ncbi:MAG: M23 family metallopeptidase [Cyclobacteriaceae bacterium]
MIKIFALLIILTLSLQLNAQGVEVFKKELEEGKIEVWVKNTSLATHTVKVDIEQSGMVQDTKTPIIKVLEGNTTEKIATLTPKPKTSYRFGYRSINVKGNALAKHDDSYIYDLPYPKGNTYKIDQGYMGTTTHMDRYALDFGMPEGSEIAAVRDGLVFDIEEKNKRGCPRQECADLSNFILVEHADGSQANYAHLQNKGVLVKIGDRVSAGDVIGLSGSTGWASGPHLHLEIFTMDWDGQKTIPVKYHLNDGIGIPKEGQSYTR